MSKRKPSTPKASASKRRPRKPRVKPDPVVEPEPVSFANGCEVVSVFGPFNSRALIGMPAELAEQLLGGPPLSAHAPTGVIDGLRHDLEALRRRAPELVDSALAATAGSLALTIENPYTSATARAACAKELREHLAELRTLAPPEEKKNPVDELRARAAKKLTPKPVRARASKPKPKAAAA